MKHGLGIKRGLQAADWVQDRNSWWRFLNQEPDKNLSFSVVNE